MDSGPEKLTILLRSIVFSGKASPDSAQGSTSWTFPSGTLGLGCRNPQLSTGRCQRTAGEETPEFTPQPPASHPVIMRELPLGFQRANLAIAGAKGKLFTLRFKNNIIGSALGYGFLPADRVCVCMGLTFTDWLLSDTSIANTFVA